MHPSVQNLSFRLGDPDIKYFENDELKPVTDEILNQVVHPQGDWALLMEFDPIDILRLERFTKDTTIRQMIDRINKGICYGWYEGIRPIKTNKEKLRKFIYITYLYNTSLFKDALERYKDVEWYSLNWGINM